MTWTEASSDALSRGELSNLEPLQLVTIVHCNIFLLLL
jgi:hypothetical protein